MAGSGSRLWWIVALLACVPLAACDDSAPEKGAKSTTTAPKKRTVADDMVAAVSAGKAATAVNVYFTLGNAPTIDTALPVDVAVLPHLDFTSLQARFSTQGDGLLVVSGDVIQPVADARAETPLEHKLVLMPKKEGVYMVTVILDTEGSDGSVSRIFSIPVIVTPPGGAAPAAPVPPAAPPATD
jgi:hypothetical protein